LNRPYFPDESGTLTPRAGTPRPGTPRPGSPMQES